MEGNQLSKEIFHQYKITAQNEATTYNHLRTAFPLGTFTKTERRFKKAAALAVLWAEVATVLCDRKVDYMAEWRLGR